jgi:anaerobic ribonucleoside-triphosphate reductase activating protein
MVKPRIIASQYSLERRAFEIYLSGCKGEHCVNCHNPESWNFNQGEIYDTQMFLKIQDKIREFPHLVDNIMIFGGEPLDSDLGEMLFELHTLDLPIWVFTHYYLEEVPQYVKNYSSYIKTGRYVPSLIVEDNVMYGIKLATSNQHIYKKDLDF